YRADLIVESRVIVEIKAGRAIIPQHAAQLLNYLKASGLQVGLLLNFGEVPEFRRVILTKRPPP
ncbi:MAG: GxxExxY protein, partial [Gemmatimonadales bacterium]